MGSRPFVAIVKHVIYRIAGFFKGENFHEFREFHIIRENFPHEIFIYNSLKLCIISSIKDTCRFMSLFKYLNEKT